MIPGEIEQRPDLHLAVRHLRLHAAARQLDTVRTQLVHGFGPEIVSRPREADGPWNSDAGQGIVDHVEFLAEFRRLLRGVECRMRPGMVPDFESAAVQVGHILPTEKVFLVVHPLVGDEKCGLESQLFEERSDEGDLRFDRIIQGQHDGFVGDAGGGQTRGGTHEQKKEKGEKPDTELPEAGMASERWLQTAWRSPAC